MANPSYSFFGLTGDPVVDATTHGYYWGLNADRTVDWSISNGFNGEVWYDPNALSSNLQNLLGTFSYFANIKFNYIGYFTSPSGAYQYGSEINVSLTDSRTIFPSPNIWARAYFDPRTAFDYAGEVGDVYLNVRSAANSLPSYEPGSAGWFVFMHELGHTLGLKHPHDNGGTGRPTLNQIGLEIFNKDWATIMSYNDDFAWNELQWDPASPMILDVLALQYIYGKNLATNAGNSIYTLSQSNKYTTLWDASGNDTVTAAGSNVDWRIVLPIYQLSSLVDTKAGVALPTSEFIAGLPKSLYWLAGDIENANGGNGNDTIYGNNSNNVLQGGGGNDFISGGAGNDTIDGGSGIDTALFSGDRSLYNLSNIAAGWVVSSIVEGTDTIKNVERLGFSDSKLALDVGANQSAGETQLLLGAVLGMNLLTQKKSFTGTVIDLFDQGYSLQALSGALMRLDIWGLLANGGRPSATNTQIANYLLTTVNKVAPDSATLAAGVNALNIETGAAQGNFLWHLAESAANQVQVGLVGLATTGLEYA